MINILKNKLNIVFFLLCLIILILFLVVVSMEKRNKIAENSLPKTEMKSEGNIDLTYVYNGDLTNLAKSLNVYYVEQAEILSVEKSRDIAVKFGFDNSPEALNDNLGTVYLFNKNNTSLFIYPNPIIIDYSDLTKNSSLKLTEDQLLEKAEKFLNERIVVESPYSIGKSYLKLKKTNSEGLLVSAKTIGETEFAEISFQLKLDTFPLIDKVYQNNPYVLLLNLDGSIKKAKLTLFSNKIKNIGKQDLTKPQQALEAINNGLGVISLLNNPNQGYTEIGSGEIKTANLSSIEIVYIYDEDVKLITPYYRFSGIAETKEGDKIEVEVLITALPEDVYKDN